MADIHQESQMTREEYDHLKKELEILKTERRDEVSEKIRVARGFGDLSENSEYDEAKNDQAQLEARIARLDEQLKNVTIVDHITTDYVVVGTKVTLLDEELNEEQVFKIAASAGDDDTITTTSPVGMAILGKRVGDEAVVKAPVGELKFKIKHIDK